MSLSEKELEKLKDDLKAGKGDVLGTSSWSTSSIVSREFCDDHIGEKSKVFGDIKNKKVMLVSKEQPRGTSICHLSYFRTEYEVVVSKDCRYKLTDAVDLDGVLYITVSPVK